MRSLVDSRSFRSSLCVSFTGLSLVASAALAHEPVMAQEDGPAPSVVTQSTTTVTTTVGEPAALPPPPMVSATPVQPAAPMYAAPTYAAPPPISYPPGATVTGPVYINGPVWIIPTQPQAPMYAPPPVQVPVYVQPPVYAAPRPYYAAPRPYFAPRPLLPRPVLRTAVPTQPRGPAMSVGLRATMLGISSQEVFGQDLNLWGAGLQLRFRSQGRFGFELAMDFLSANIGEGLYVRNSYPITISPMLYLFQNRPNNHFNLYVTGGVGLMADDISLYAGSARELNQQFWQFLAQGGGGVELRFKRLALFGDVRGVGMMLDDSSPAGVYYQGAIGGPIPASSSGYKVNLGASLWF